MSRSSSGGATAETEGAAYVACVAALDAVVADGTGQGPNAVAEVAAA